VWLGVLTAMFIWIGPGVATAATVEVQNRTLTYTAAGTNDSTLEVSGPACFSPIPGPCPPASFLIRLLDFGDPYGRSSGGEAMTPGAGCDYGENIFGPPGPGQPPLPWPPDREVYCSGDVDLLVIRQGAGDDWLFDSSDRPAVINGESGNDRLEDGSANDLVMGGSGNDVFHANGGDDALIGEDGSDRYYALECPVPPQPCDPAVNSAIDTGRDSFTGGPGIDVADFSDIFASERLSADGAADDGKAGEGDNIGGDVEEIHAGPFGDRLVGNASDNTLDGGGGEDTIAGGPGGDVIRGGEGADALDGGAGADSFQGGGGTDSALYRDRTSRVVVSLDDSANDGARGERDDVRTDVENVTTGSGADDLTGSAGANRLDGGTGEDFVDGGTGSDVLAGGGSADTLRLRDGSGDAVAGCGDGIDFVIADPGDRAGADCELVDDVLRDRPALGRRVAVQPRATSLGLGLPAARRLVPLLDHVNVPVRSRIDSSAGPVKVTSSAGISRRKRRSGVFSGGLFRILQARRGRQRGITELRMSGASFKGCRPRRGSAAETAARRLSRRTIRRLRGRAKGRFRTRGRYSAATVRGKKWVMTDRCDGTLTRVTRGRVAVRDFRRKRTILVSPGKRYLARAPR
jgi:Ca2+-binding RTX toxin-like protein